MEMRARIFLCVRMITHDRGRCDHRMYRGLSARVCTRKYQRQPASPPSSFCTQRPQSASPIVASSPPAPHRRPIDVDTLLPPPMTLDVSATHASQANARAMLRGSSGPIASFPTATRAPRHRRVGQPLQRAVPCLRRAALCFSQLVGQHLFVTALVSALCLDGLRTVVRQTVRPTPLRSAPKPNQQNLSTAAAVAPRSFRVRFGRSRHREACASVACPWTHRSAWHPSQPRP